jgi:glutamyl-Q tRNA(Asp) synthetase
VFTTRFAPSPTGYLHRGHAFSALTAFRAAQAEAGRFVLRIEDIDTTRCRPEFEAAAYEDLAWLGLEWEQPVRRQSEHLADYEAALERLRGQGLLYRCFRTRKQVAEDMLSAPHGPVEAFRGAALHPNEEERMLEEDRPFAWRLSLDAAAEQVGGFNRLFFVDNDKKVRANPALAGDVILARKDVGVAYHLAVVVDDALQKIDHVIRGEDLAEATHIQRLLQALLKLPTPAYRHHPLLKGPDGRRYAKRDKAVTLSDLRAQGVTAEQLRAELGFD